MRLNRGFLLLGLLLAGGASFAASPQAASPAPSPPALTQLLRGVENRYNRMRSMKAEFQQFYRHGGAVRQEQGTLYLSKPGRMRWEYENPEPKLFLTDGRRLILYVPSENRVMESAVRETDDLRAPLAFLLGRLDFTEQFGRYETSPSLRPMESGNSVFRAYPKRLGERLEWVLFEVTPQYQIRRIVLREVGGVETEFRFQQETTNPALAASLFQFRAPAGVEVIQE